MEAVNLSAFDELSLPEGCEFLIKENILIFNKWNWEYSSFLDFQNKAHTFIRKNKNLKIYIFCNHPHVYTTGRGNERGETGLVTFDNSLKERLPHEVFPIHRGGGITFHHPGQWIFYPITAIKESYSLDDHMCWLLKSTASVLKDSFEVENVVTAKKLMGVWCERKKLASIGVGVNRFVTLHGIALNLVNDIKTKKALSLIHPCGMNADIYTSVAEVSSCSGEDMLSRFHNSFLKSFIL